MSTNDFITELFCRIDDTMRDVPKHSQANLFPSEIVNLGFLFALKGVDFVIVDHSMFHHSPSKKLFGKS